MENILSFFFQKYFSLLKNGQKKCPKMKKGERLLKNSFPDCIIENYGLVTKNIIFNLLRYFFFIFIKKSLERFYLDTLWLL
jgi:hypothetical protein